MTEAQWQQQVIDLAKLGGWRSYHTFDSRRSAPGFPDLVLLRPPELVFVEVKAEKGKTTPEQDAWLEDLGVVAQCILLSQDSLAGDEIPVQVYVWRPSDFDEVRRVLLERRS
jgi:hypothetical protein